MNETISHSISLSSHKVEIRYEDTILCEGFIANLLYCVMAEQMGFDSDNAASFWGAAFQYVILSVCVPVLYSLERGFVDNTKMVKCFALLFSVNKNILLSTFIPKMQTNSK